MAGVEQIFGAALSQGERERTAPQGVDAVVSPVAQPLVDSPAAEIPQTEPMLHLAMHVMAAWRTNVQFRDSSGVSDKLQYALDANTCRYTDRQIAALASVGIPTDLAKKLFTPMTFKKTRAAKSLMLDIAHSVSEPLFEVSPSPWPDTPKSVDEEVYESMSADIAAIFRSLAQDGGAPLPPEGEAVLNRVIAEAAPVRRNEVQNRREQFARTRTKRMQKKIWDMIVEGGGEKAHSDCIANVCTYGTGVIVGPCPRVVAANRCREGRNGVRRYVREYQLKPVFESVSPMDCYPAPDAKDASDGPFCIRVKYSAESLWRFCDATATKDKNGEGWNAATIRGILERHPRGGVKIRTEPESSDKRTAENNGVEDPSDCTFEGVRCFLSIRGSELAELGIVRNRDGKKILLNDYYHVEAIVVDGYTVYCRILDARLGVPVSKCVFYELPGSWWGESIADKLKQVQTMQNNTCKALFLDLAATGPMFYVNGAQNLVDKTPGALKYEPYKFVGFDTGSSWGPGAATGAPIGMIDAPSKAAALTREWEMWENQADNDSGIPRFAEGQTSGAQGALRTSGGLAQMNEHMLRGMKTVMMMYDQGVIRPVAQKSADWILAYDDDMELKGDVFIRPIGLMGRVLRAQRDQQRLQLFNMVASNPALQQLVGPKGLIALLRPSVQDLDINPDDVLPDEDKMRWMEDVQKLATLANAEAQAQRGAEAAQSAGGEPQGQQPGVAPVASPGGVAERRAVA